MLQNEMEKALIDIYQLREQRRLRVTEQIGQPLVQLSLNLPLGRQLPAGADGLFAWGLRQMLDFMPQLLSCAHGHDRLGPWALLGTANDAETLKRQAVALENAHPAGTLLDIDVYDQDGQKLLRKDLLLPARQCPICHELEAECRRAERHSSTELKTRIKKLLAPFRA